jgi:hypothetical protein
MTDVSEVLAASVIRAVTHCPDDGEAFQTTVVFEIPSH